MQAIGIPQGLFLWYEMHPCISWSCLFCQRVNNKTRPYSRDCKCSTLPDNYERDMLVRPVKSNTVVWTYMEDHEPSPNVLGCHGDPPEPGNDMVTCQVFLNATRTTTRPDRYSRASTENGPMPP